MPARKPSAGPRRQVALSALSAAFSQRLKDTRIDRDLSQVELAEASGVGATYISELERGMSEPTLAIVERLANALGVEPADMLKAATRAKK